MAKRTPLYDKHVALGGKMVEFAGFDMPVQYSGVIAEHNAVRNAVGVFDVSHMGEFFVEGKDAESVINSMVTNDVRGMYDGQVRYSLLPNDKGGAVDDILVYRVDGEHFVIVVNAANTEKDFAWMLHFVPESVKFENRSYDIAQLAVQGPKAVDVIKKMVIDPNDIPVKYYSFKTNVFLKDGVKCTLSRTGYTGEDGFEIYADSADAEKLLDDVLEDGKEFGILPCGLGARDTLRLESAMPLYGHELGDDIPVDEVGLGFAIKPNKDIAFVGQSAIKNHTPEYVRIGARVEKGIAREHSDVYCGDEMVGIVTSGTHSPTLGYPVCMLRVKKEFADKPLQADVRGRRLNLDIVPLPFYKRAK